MASTNAQIAKRIADALNDSRGHTQGRNVVKKATYSSGNSFTVVLRERGGDDNNLERTVTITGS